MAHTISTRLPPGPTKRSTGPALTLMTAGTGLVALVMLVLTQVASRWDTPALAWVTDHRTGAWESAGRLGGALAAGPAVVVLGLLTIATLWLLRDRAAATVMTVLLLAAGALTVLGKNGVGRARPPETVQIAPVETGSSFPSGHTLFAVTLWGGAALLLTPHLRPSRQGVGGCGRCRRRARRGCQPPGAGLPLGLRRGRLSAPGDLPAGTGRPGSA